MRLHTIAMIIIVLFIMTGCDKQSNASISIDWNGDSCSLAHYTKINVDTSSSKVLRVSGFCPNKVVEINGNRFGIVGIGDGINKKTGKNIKLVWVAIMVKMPNGDWLYTPEYTYWDANKFYQQAKSITT
jgi:hypothetical protein